MRIRIILLSIFLISFSMSSGKNEIKGILYNDGTPVSVSIVDGKIVDIQHLPSDASLPQVYIAPGLIDIQINGFMGVDFSSQDLTAPDLKKATKALWKVGVTTFLPTVVPNELSHMKKSFQLLSSMMEDEDIALSVPGFHLEGPFISPVQGFRGAHLEKYIRQPNWDEFCELRDASQNRIKIITLAPEANGAIPFIAKCAESGIVVSLGHHNGSSEDIRAAVEAGASLSTHLGNGCANMIDRHLNPLWPQLANDNLTAGIIVDGFHLTRDEVKCFYKMKGPEKTILVSDAVDLAGLQPGEYFRREKHLVLTPDNVVRFPAENVLAGAASPLSICVGNVMKFTGCSLADAIRMASTNPAKLIGLKDRGEIRQGKRADLILFKIENNKIVILKTIVAGKEVYSVD